MHRDRSFHFTKQWKAIQREQGSLDYRKAQWCKSLRAELGGDDERFATWCGDEIGMTPAQSRDLLALASAATIVPDEKTWSLVGGSRAITRIVPLPRAEQVRVIEAAKVSGKSIRTIVRERGLDGMPPTTQASAQLVSQAHRDASELARFIAKNLRRENIPLDVQQLINLYAPGRLKSDPAVIVRKAA